MKAITIKQPWATLMALGEKRFETRGWQTKHRGELAIHAGKQVDRDACEIPKIKKALARHGYTADNLPTGAVIAIAELKECFGIRRDVLGGVVALEADTRKTHFNTLDKEFAFGWFESGRYAWELAGVQQLPQPIPAKGQLSIWNWEGVQS
ncbi:ASCH domain-containing protein [Paenibacillus sp. FSL R7-0331]|uniref:ASCH domain-containing protein n=1 Tax=Paenibacillus sp. FSL R7-0331 TaxID=1536773 RepID=UPI0004F748F9|nr:ASCH domain-containing protein [Paenibacillus sp. FSL R7-0331]AIQ54527.1 2-oxoglutarate dehydrogenase E1 [Paenibacillus sp. FSL R7-0331]